MVGPVVASVLYVSLNISPPGFFRGVLPVQRELLKQKYVFCKVWDSKGSAKARALFSCDSHCAGVGMRGEWMFLGIEEKLKRMK